MPIVRSSPVLLFQANGGKLDTLHGFLEEYRRVVQCTIDHAWNNRLLFGEHALDIQNGQLNMPSFLPVACLPEMDTPLSGRAIKCATTQAMSMLKAALKRRIQDVAWLSKLDGSPVPRILAQRLNRPLVKPSATGVSAELNSICAKLVWTPETSFDGWIVLSSLGKSFGKLQLPINRHRHLNRIAHGKQLTSLLISETRVDVRFVMEPKTKSVSAVRVVGADTGLKTVLSLSDGQTTPESDCHGHSLQSICHELARKKKGSKAFGRAQEHRKNFINWSLNRLNLSTIAEIRLERVKHINYGRRASRFMQAWTNADIQRKVLMLAEEQNVSVKLQSSAYRSQRCSCCGMVRKANRKGKIYSCKGCGFICDADLNAARNHEQDLPPIPAAFFRTGKNTGKGFYWRSTGCSLSSGVELAVPPSNNQA